jgi:VanZ family protein
MGMPSTSPSFPWVISILYTVAITIASLTSNTKGLPSFTGSDKLAHFFAYGLYVLLISWVLQVRTRPLLCITAIAVFCSFYGILMEFCQKLLAPASRSFSVGDMVANIAGAATCALVVARLRQPCDHVDQG